MDQHQNLSSVRLKDDQDIVLEAVKKIGYALNFASEGLKDNQDFVLKVVK